LVLLGDIDEPQKPVAAGTEQVGSRLVRVD
jgi:hypothetical protein